MKIKNKIITLLTVFTLVGLTHSLTLKDLNAALTAPASYDYSYTYDGLFTYELNVSPNYLYYTRTADGIYYNYSSTFELINGLEITQTFNRSNTSWTFVSGLPGGYTPSDTKIGSNGTVGTISNKVNITINNQTNKKYILWIDYSSNPNTYGFNYIIDGNEISFLSFFNSANLLDLYVPSYTQISFQSVSTSAAYYFDAWYLKDLGVSASYDAGVDAGELIGYDNGYADGLGNNPNVLLNGFQAMVGILVNFVLMIVNLEVFGVSIIDIFAIVVLFTGIVWVLKLIRG
jgi:hypothetical protein